MPGLLLNTSSRVMCLHGGQATPTAPVPRVLVMGQPVVTQPAPWAVGGCPFTVPPPTPCLTAQWVTASLRITVLGQPVLLADSKAVCAPTGATVNVIPAQSRVQGV